MSVFHSNPEYRYVLCLRPYATFAHSMGLCVCGSSDRNQSSIVPGFLISCCLLESDCLFEYERRARREMFTVDFRGCLCSLEPDG